MFLVSLKNDKNQNKKLMKTEVRELDFQGQDIFIGIDVHLKNWRVTIMTEHLFHKTFSQDPNAKTLADYLRRNFPGGTYYSAYEAGFCGFSVHRSLEAEGIQNIVVNPADIPTTDKDRKQKEDNRDSRKIAKSLRNGELVALHVPNQDLEELRGLVRYRKTLVKDISRNKARIKSFLHLHGVRIPYDLSSASQHWSANFTSWLTEVRLSTDHGHLMLGSIVGTVTHLRKELLAVNRQLRSISTSSCYQGQVGLLRSIPGIGLVVSMTLVSELGDINRFKSLDKLCSYIGLIPTTASSGESDRTGNITPRSNKPLRSVLIESAWVASRNDPALSLAYNELCKRMKPNRAIIKIAKKLLNRIRYVLKNGQAYEYAIVQ